jgi:3-hydroxybutyryl-CoA dehydrogenase
MTLERVGVVGAGLMGSGIAEVCARAGLDVVVHEVSPDAADAGRARIEKSLGRGVERGKLATEERDAALGRLSFVTNLAAMSDRQVVVEAVTEDESLKLDIFRALDEAVTDRGALLASNTSSLPITRLATATSRPDRVVGLHFFNPVPVMRLVELVSTVLTADEAMVAATEFAGGVLGKTVIRAKDRAGFVVNLLLVPYLLEGIRMYEAGYASAEDIDTGMREGANHPMGPLELSDFVGLDTMKAVADVLYQEFHDPHYAAPPLLVRMVEAGLLGRKSGRGFYTYS